MQMLVGLFCLLCAAVLLFVQATVCMLMMCCVRAVTQPVDRLHAPERYDARIRRPRAVHRAY